MAVHDPESSLQEKQQALKMGRQKKIQIIDGQRVEVLTGMKRSKSKRQFISLTWVCDSKKFLVLAKICSKEGP